MAEIPAMVSDYIMQYQLPLITSQTTAAVTNETIVTGVCFDSEGILFVHSARPGRRWELPSGGVKANESPEEAVKRELLEETGRKVRRCTPACVSIINHSSGLLVQLVYRVELETNPVSPVDDEIAYMGHFEKVPHDVSFGEPVYRMYSQIIPLAYDAEW